MHYARFTVPVCEGWVMKKMLLMLAMLLCAGGAKGDISFGSNEALLTIADSATLLYDPVEDSALAAGGLKAGAGTLLTAILLSDGVVRQEGNEYARLTNMTYGAAGEPTFAFIGNSTLEGFNNFKLSHTTASGSNNAIKGSFNLIEPLTFGDGLSFRCGFTTPVNNNLTLLSTTIYLENDLVFASDAHFTGNGAVLGQGHSIIFGTYYHSAVNNYISWAECDDIQFRGNMALNGHWYFFGSCCINGNGATLDLRHDSTFLMFAAGSHVTLRNITIKGITSEKWIFHDAGEGSAAPVVTLDGARLHFDDSFTLSRGAIEVVGDSTVVLGEYYLTFNEDAHLTVDAATLSINVLSNAAEPASGTICAPAPLFVDHVKDIDAIAANVSAGNLSLNSGGVIAELSQVLVGRTEPDEAVISLDKTQVLSPTDRVVFDDNATIDGGGSRLTFASPAIAQFAIAAGKRVRLSNIELYAITNSTFSLGAGAVLEIGENVIFTLAGDVTWSAEQLCLVGSSDTFEIRSMGPQYTWKFESEGHGDEPHELTYDVHLALGTNSLLCRNIVLIGLRHISYSSEEGEGATFVGEIILGGDATVCITELVVDQNFSISGLNNVLRLLQHNTTFRDGTIQFDEYGINALTFTSILPISSYGAPVINLWDGALNLSSTEGTAYCLFDIPAVTVRNRVENAFVLGPNGVLAGQQVSISDNPIVQTSARTSIVPGTVLTSSLSAGALSFSRDLLDSMRGPGHRSRKAGRMRREPLAVWRGVSLPNESLKPVVHLTSALALPVLAGNVTLQESYGQSYTNLRVSEEQSLNLTLYDGVRVVQADAATTFKTDDVLNVVGGTVAQPNVLRLSNTLTIGGSIMLDDNAVLCIEAAPNSDGTVVQFSPGFRISFGQKSTLLLNGISLVTLPGSQILDFGDTQSFFIVGKGTRLDLVDGDELTVTGCGTLQCQESGQITLGRGTSLCCGSSHADRITLRLKEGGIMRVGSVLNASDPVARLSFARGINTLDCSRGGRLIITARGVCECNAHAGAPTASSIQAIDFSSGGSLFIAAHGLLSVSSNASGDGIDLLLDGATISGAGLVGITGSAFCGKLQPNLTSATGLTAAELVRLLVQTKTNLACSTVYFDEEDHRVLRTKNGVLVPLTVNQVIATDTEAGVVSGYNALTGRRFSYDANGVLPS